MITHLLSAGAVFFALADVAVAQAPAPQAEAGRLKFSGSFRVRLESIDGQPRPGFNTSDDLLSLRAKLAAEYDWGPIKFFGELYDSRAYGADRGTPITTGEVNTLEPVQAYVSANLGSPFGTGSAAAVQAGRFTLNLGSRRFVAADDYRNTTNGYTGLKADLSFKNGGNATAFYVFPQVREPGDLDGILDNDVHIDRETKALQLRGAVASAPVGLDKAALQVSFLNLLEADEARLPTRNRHLDTWALRYFREPAAGLYDFDGEAAIQTGSIRTSLAPAAARQDVWARYLHLEAGYKWNLPAKPRLALEYDYVSGDRPGGSFGRFDTLYGMRRAELAPAGLYNSVGRANISTPGIRLEVEPSPRWDAFVGYRALYLASDTDTFSTTGVRDATGRSGDFAGNQFDSRVRYWLVPQRLRLEGNFVYMAKGEFLKRAPNAPDDADTKYLTIDLTASF